MKRLLKTSAALALLLSASATALAGWGGATLDFSVTNYVACATATASQTYGGWPTNQAGYSNGVPVNVSQLQNLVLCVEGMVGTTNSSPTPVTISVTLIGSSAGGGGPRVTVGTNAFNASQTNPPGVVTYNDWQTANASLNTYTFALPVGYTNGYFNFLQPLPNGSLPSQATWIGVSNIVVTGLGTNSNTNYPYGFITNFDISVQGKTIVAPFSF